MAGIVVGQNRVGVREVGNRVTVSQDNRARLMFYLDCMCNVLNLDDEENLARLRRYSNYVLTTDQERRLFALCLVLSPDVLFNKCIFMDDEMCGDLVNQFYELSAVQDRMLITENIMVGNQSRRVQKIMFFKRSFLQNYYFAPMIYMKDKMENRERQLQQQQRQAITYHPPPPPRRTYTPPKSSSCVIL